MFETYVNTEQKRFTYSDYAAMDDDKRYELINGNLIMVPGPFSSHERSNKKLLIKLDDYIESYKLGEVFVAPFDVIFDEFNTVQPDIFVITKDNFSKIKKNAIYGAPDLAVEIISPWSIQRDRIIKKELYEKHGVREYWLVDTDKKSVEVFNNSGLKFDLFSISVEKGRIESYLFPEMEIMIEDIFPEYDFI